MRLLRAGQRSVPPLNYGVIRRVERAGTQRYRDLGDFGGLAFMLDHIDIGTTDFERSRRFYVSALAPLGIRALMDIKRHDGRAGTGFGCGSDPQFWIGEGSPVSGRLHFAFVAKSRELVDAFYAAALGAGGKSKGAPGLRPRYGEHYYAAFVYDLDGHTVEAVCRERC